MNSLEYSFEVLEPEFEDAIVSIPQMLVFYSGLDEVRVIVYFMENSAVTVTGGVAKSAMGKIKLYYKSDSPSGAYAGSVSLRKVAFVFRNAQGLARNFEFHGQKT